MKRTGINLILLAGSVLCFSSSQAGIMTVWNFPSTGTPTFPISASSSSGTSATALNGTLTESHAQSYVSGNLLQFSFNGSSPSQFNNKTLTLSITASSTETISGLSYSTEFNNASASSPLTQTWQYSVNGGNAVNIGSANLTSTALTPENFTFAVSVPSGESIVFTDTITGASGNNGNLDFGGINVVPEPINSALLGFGILFVGVSTCRFYLSYRFATVVCTQCADAAFWASASNAFSSGNNSAFWANTKYLLAFAGCPAADVNSA